MELQSELENVHRFSVQIASGEDSATEESGVFFLSVSFLSVKEKVIPLRSCHDQVAQAAKQYRNLLPLCFPRSKL